MELSGDRTRAVGSCSGALVAHVTGVLHGGVDPDLLHDALNFLGGLEPVGEHFGRIAEVVFELGQVRQRGEDAGDRGLPCLRVGKDGLALPREAPVHLGAGGQRFAHRFLI